MDPKFYKTFAVIVLQASLMIISISGVSQWDPFCKENILYTPYVRVFQKGRSGALLRDRGPGFLDVNGLQDIYVCTNGLVMLYYSKTKGAEELYEEGELHWAPHHCQLYNPSCTKNGVDWPGRSLKSILLIGHPQDYRRPALQMFVAPAYDKVYGNYVNLTSLIMISTEGECILEKGVEQAKIRVRVNRPPAPPPADPAKPVATPKPPIFCQLDSQRKLGQTGIVTLAQVDDPTAATLPIGFDGSPWDVATTQSETGSTVMPRFKFSTSELIKTPPPEFPGTEKLGPAADEAYAALLHDRKIQFLGCLRYPDFSREQETIILKRNMLINGNDTAVPIIPSLEIKDDSSEYTIIATEPFWAEKVKPPWPEVLPPPGPGTPGDTTKPRAEIYELDKFVGIADEQYTAAAKAFDTAKQAFDDEKVPDEKAKKEVPFLTEKMKLSLWPYKKVYANLRKYLQGMYTQLKTAWTAIAEKSAGATGNTPKVEEAATHTANAIAEWRYNLSQEIALKKNERRLNPYNPDLIKAYDNYTNLTEHFGVSLRDKSVELGPLISNAEVLYSKYMFYRTQLKKSITDLENAIRKLEKTRQSVEYVGGGDIFGKLFTDTLIQISDAPHAAATEVAAPGKACYELPTPQDACKGIKPDSKRACELLKNRKGKGLEWTDGDNWRQTVLDLIERIFLNVCPYITHDFALLINRMVKGYLLGAPLGTGLITPINGSRLYAADHSYQTKVYNLTYAEMNQTANTNGTLRAKDSFWDHIIAALNECEKTAAPMEFFHNEEGDRPAGIFFLKYFPNNKTEVEYDVEELFMEEKAELEYVFNWAIDMNWRVFATVLGICMPSYETKIPLISARFYALYTQDFLRPLRQIWMSNRDNSILKTILGNIYGTGKGERWSRICMESSFVSSGDRTFRPPRGLYVNAFTEMNYFTNGPMAGTSGRLAEVL